MNAWRTLLARKGVDRMPPENEESFKPRGTWALVIGFTIVLVILWFSVYLTLLSRGVTT